MKTFLWIRYTHTVLIIFPEPNDLLERRCDKSHGIKGYDQDCRLCPPNVYSVFPARVLMQVAEQEQRLIRKDMCIASLHQSISAQQEISYDGTFLWKICNVSQKLREAASGQTSSQYSSGTYIQFLSDLL